MNKLNIDQILRGEGTPAEREEFFARVMADKQLKEQYILRKNEQTFATLPNEPMLSRRRPKPVRRVSLITALTQIAAVLFLPLCGYFIYDMLLDKERIGEFEHIAQSAFVNEINYRVDRGVKGHILLADSTEVWLNSDSDLKVPATFDHSSERVVALSGEAYFVVKSDAEHPFYIKTPQDVLVKVTGTEFNLNAYAERPDIHLSLVKGSVELIKENDNSPIEVAPNQEAIVGKQERVVSSSVKKVADKSVWKEGTLKFVGTPMKEMIPRLERWYGVQINVSSRAVYDAVFTATFKEESITQVLDLLGITSNIKYSINNNQVILSK